MSPEARSLRDRRMNASGVNAGNRNRRAPEFVPYRLRESPNGKFACRIGALAWRSNHSEDARQVDDVGARLLLQNRKEIRHTVYDAPKIDAHQPAQIVERQFFERAMKGHARIVDEQRYSAVPPSHIFGETTHRGFLGDIHYMR